MAIPAYLMTKDLEKRIEPIEDPLIMVKDQIKTLGDWVMHLEKQNKELAAEVEALKLKVANL